MPIGAQEELGLRMISLSMLMALSSCPSFPGESSDPKKESLAIHKQILQDCRRD